MPTLPDCFPALAAKKTSLPELAALFEVLSGRAQACARLQDALLEDIMRNRAARSGKSFQHSKRQQKMLTEFDRDAENARREQEVLVAGMDDVSLLANALVGEENQLRWDAQMNAALPAEVQDPAIRVLEFRKETIRILNDFIDALPLKQKVRSLVQNMTPKKNRS